MNTSTNHQSSRQETKIQAKNNHKKWLAILSCLAILALLCITFELGATVGYRKAAFDYHLGDNYYRTFGPGNSTAPDGDFPGAHGISGTIVRIEPPYAVIEGSDRVEKTIRIGSSTSVVEYRNSVDPGSLSEGEFIVVIGSPDASTSEVDAHFVRILPQADTASATPYQEPNR